MPLDFHLLSGSGCRYVALLAVLLALGARAEVPLRTAAEVQALSPEQARAHREVRLTGVITFAWHSGTTEFTVQDETGTVWLPPVLLRANCGVGTQVEIEGRTEFGSFGPIVQAEVVRTLGPGTLPPAVPATCEELYGASLQGRRVALTGIVRGQRVNPEFGLGWLALEIAAPGGRVTVNVTHEITGHPELIDACVRVSGVNLLGSDARQQSSQPMLYAHTLADLEILAPARPEPFAQAAVPLNQILRLPDPAGVGHRVRVRGSVTVVLPGGSFFLQDETRGLQVFPRDSFLPQPGEILDVVGFPEPGGFSPVLRDADWRPTGERNRVSPQTIRSPEAAQHDGRLVTVRGRLASVAVGDGETLLALETAQGHFRAHVPGAVALSWRAGSELEITGVCRVEAGDWESRVRGRPPREFLLFVRGAEDIRVVRAAPFWTPTRVAWALVGVGLALGGALGWVWRQTRRRLREEASTREAARLQFEAVIEERTRMAREIHDTLAQGFTGISAQLEVLNDRLGDLPKATRHHLDLARELVRSSLAEARRTVWNLRSQTLEENGLAGAFARLGRQLTDGSPLAFQLQVEGEPRTLPAEVENNLLRIGEEAITNAVRHSKARQLTLSLKFIKGAVHLSVIDDGCGYDSASGPSPTKGGFGVPGLRERANAIHAKLEIHSAPGRGTHIHLTIPHV